MEWVDPSPPFPTSYLKSNLQKHRNLSIKEKSLYRWFSKRCWATGGMILLLEHRMKDLQDWLYFIHSAQQNIF